MKILWLLLFPVFCFSTNFTLVTFPKSGTHVLLKLLRYPSFGSLDPTDDRALARTPHAYYSGHFIDIFHLKQILAENPKQKFLLNIRDFRDTALSMVDWCVELHRVPFRHPIDTAAWNALSREGKIESMFHPEIWGESWILQDWRYFKELVALVPPNQLFITSYEKLVGSKGGGSDAVQREEIKRIAAFLSIPLSLQQIREIANTLYGNAYTFRKGKIKRWEREFTNEMHRLANHFFGDALLEFKNFFEPLSPHP